MSGLREILAKRVLLIFCPYLTFSSILFGISIPHYLAETFSISKMNNQNFSISNLQGNCSTWIGIAPEEGSENSTDIVCLNKVLERCQPFNATLGYVLGSMRVSILGLKGDSQCLLGLLYEIEGGQSNLTCSIPLAKIPAWTNWKRGDGLDTLDQIRNDYCIK
jgi:hypothetical protein